MERDPEIPFTYDYSQPQEYHFSLDSIEMAWKVSKYLLSRSKVEALNSWNCLDLCAGCGVIGFELNFHIPQLKNWDFVEVQEIYQEHFASNRQKALERHKILSSGLAQNTKPRLSLVGAVDSKTDKTSDLSLNSSPPKFRFLLENYDQRIQAGQSGEEYQLIVCNPPYFFPQQGNLSPSEFKNRCRFFLDSSFENLIESIVQSLAMDGEAFLLLRDLEDHKIDLLTELRRLLRGRLQCENLDMVRGTFLLRLFHPH